MARIFLLEPKWSDRELTAAVTAMRLFAGLRRLHPFEGRALLASSSPQEIAFAEWLLHELSTPPDAKAVRQTTSPYGACSKPANKWMSRP